ncbi:hypothetical protein I308_102597 [Cryptococcus tetragattii IND107]|uniref:Type 1 phosphatases regulator n=1 Tax=Cryptococcus tetragattii IND107 TaxID=1296105 RepID=A0ABR3BU99_9TREE
MSLAQRSPPTRTSTATLTQTQTTPTDTPPQTVLQLRAGPSTERRVVWTEETVDNEGLGKKKSKICCIYHKPRAFDESSSDESSSDESSSETDRRPSRGSKDHRHRLKGDSNVEDEQSSESDGGAGDGRARPLRKPHRHHHSNKCDHSDHAHKPNKYDVQPKGTGKSKETS